MTAPITMRSACRCGQRDGYIVEKGAQDVVRCLACDAYQYCAPRTETGKATRTVRSTPSVAPSKRDRVLKRGNYACVQCGRRSPDVQLHLGHLISVDAGKTLGIPDALIWHDFNLAAFCDECNLGLGAEPVAVDLMYRCLLVHLKQVGEDVEEF
jgi:5-methylcytosine-specific restriction endonuclease McrA